MGGLNVRVRVWALLYSRTKAPPSSDLKTSYQSAPAAAVQFSVTEVSP
jgi:hypothetical protein